jgi:hypothetical protein
MVGQLFSTPVAKMKFGALGERCISDLRGAVGRGGDRGHRKVHLFTAAVWKKSNIRAHSEYRAPTESDAPKILPRFVLSAGLELSFCAVAGRSRMGHGESARAVGLSSKSA